MRHPASANLVPRERCMIVRFLLALIITALLFGQTGPMVDHHQHLRSPASVKTLGGSAPVTAADLIRMLDQAGIRRAVVLSTAYQYGNPNRRVVENEYDMVKAENDWTSQQVAQFPDRLRAYCSMNPLKDYAMKEIERCAKDSQLRVGLKLHFGNSDVQLDRADHLLKIRQVFQSANEHQMSIVVHMHSSVTLKRPYGAGFARTFLEQVIPQAPKVPIQVAHLAGAGGYDPTVDEALGVFVEAIEKKDPRMKNVYFDVSGMQSFPQGSERSDLITKRIRQLGVKRVLYGSDGTFGGGQTPRERWQAFHQLSLSDAEFEAIKANPEPKSSH